MAAVQASLPPSHFYRETLGSEHLSQNLASNELFTPLQLERVTVSPTRFEKYRSNLEKKPRLPWGRLRDYGGLQKVQLPEELIKPRSYPPEVVQKGHRHYGTGASDPRDLPVEQYYDVTHLSKSHVRTNDQVLPPSPSKEMNERRIDLPFPAEHPYTSHIPRFALFPSFTSPDDPEAGDPGRSSKPIHPDAPASPYKVLILNKSKGSPYRREVQEYPHVSEKDALVWPGENDFYQLMKSLDGGKQPYYPTPPKIIHPNLRLRNEDQRLELRTVNALRNLERDQWKTTYDYNFTGNGPDNAMHLDDYHKKMVDQITTKEESRNHDLRPATSPTFVPQRPQEGRYARLYQQRRHVSAGIRYPDEDPKPDPPDVMDHREYVSLPGTPRSLRRKDEWYITGRKSADPAMQTEIKPKEKEDESRQRSYLPHPLPDADGDEQWKIFQFSSHPEHGIHKIENKKKNLPHPQDAGEYDNLPKTVEECIKLPEVTRHYLKDYQDERNERFKKIEDHHEMKKFELQYDPGQDMHAMRNKMDQMGNRLEPKALDQHATQVVEDGARLHSLRTNSNKDKERYNTGLKFTTENISDRGTITDLHDRQLEGYKDFPKTWRKDISVVDIPQQNHKSVLESYISRTNPFSLSEDTQRNIPSFRSGESKNSSKTSTGSILKIPGSPPRIGPSRNISFNEVVRVATSEYGSRFVLSSSPLSSSDSGSESLRRVRSATPLPYRSMQEPSVYSGMTNSGPALRPGSTFPHEDTMPAPQPDWRWNYDRRLSAKFDRFSWSPIPSTPRPQSALLDIQNNWSKSDAHRRLHESLPERAPDMREHTRHYELADKSADLRFHHSIKHKEKRHNFYGFNSYHFYNGNAIV